MSQGIAINTVDDLVNLTPSLGQMKLNLSKCASGLPWQTGDNWFNCTRFPILIGEGDRGSTGLVVFSKKEIRVNPNAFETTSSFVEINVGRGRVKVGLKFSSQKGEKLIRTLDQTRLDVLGQFLYIPDEVHLTILTDMVDVDGDSWMLSVAAAIMGWPSMYYTGTGLLMSGGILVVDPAQQVRQKAMWCRSISQIIVVSSQDAEFDVDEKFEFTDIMKCRQKLPSAYVLMGTAIAQLMAVIMNVVYYANVVVNERALNVSADKERSYAKYEDMDFGEFFKEYAGMTLDEFSQKYSEYTDARAHELGFSMGYNTAEKHIKSMAEMRSARNPVKLKAYVDQLAAIAKKATGGPAPKEQVKKRVNLFNPEGPTIETSVITQAKAAQKESTPFVPMQSTKQAAVPRFAPRGTLSAAQLLARRQN